MYMAGGGSQGSAPTTSGKLNKVKGGKATFIQGKAKKSKYGEKKWGLSVGQKRGTMIPTWKEDDLGRKPATMARGTSDQGVTFSGMESKAWKRGRFGGASKKGNEEALSQVKLNEGLALGKKKEIM